MEGIILYNKHNQHFEVLGRFRVSNTEYARVKFTTSKHEQIVVATKLNTGDFADESISLPKVSKQEIKASLEKLDEIVEKTEINPVPPVQITTGEFKPLGLDIEGSLQAESVITVHAEKIPTKLVDTDDFVSKVVATNPKGKDLIVAMDELEGFCDKNKLDYDVVISVLEGHQKTHKKWRFKRA
jgi:hypothetical protein